MSRPSKTFAVDIKVTTVYTIQVDAETGAEARALVQHDMATDDRFIHDLTHDGCAFVDYTEIGRVAQLARIS